MIVEALFDIFKTVVLFLDGLLPDWQPLELSGFTFQLQQKQAVLFKFLAWLDWYLPVHEAIDLIGVVVALIVSWALYSVSERILRALRLIG